MLYVFLGKKPDGNIHIDHIDNNPENNKSINLQYITRRENLSKDRSGSSVYTGVCWDKKRGKWKSYFRIDNIIQHCGYFDSEKRASIVINLKLKEHELSR